MIHFYKPNPKITGSACSFGYIEKDGNFFASIIKQAGWNEKAKTGSFIQNKNNPAKKITIKLNRSEIGAIIDSLQSGREFKNYHSSQNQVVRFSFSEYVKEGALVGHSFSANKEMKDDSTQKVSAVIGFTFPDMALLIEHLKYLLHKDFARSDRFGPAGNETNDEQGNGRINAQDDFDQQEEAPALPPTAPPAAPKPQSKENYPTKSYTPVEKNIPKASQNDDDIW